MKVLKKDVVGLDPRLVEGVSPFRSGVLGGGGRVFDNGGLEGGVVGAAN